ncbi:hypothetical protein OsJ_23958 [Oryza sativa Japonica Group]|uniref:Uncharacterized protein n=1 Tax=Oryza sativa subsp. japonica TaxID=39947 RepID=B9FWT9_ORYSJ|nr:hypothetical protein OsJ_23958 [Oryza sativa Japonica Group]
MAPAGGKRRTLLDPSDGNNRDRGTLSSPPLCLLGPPPPPPDRVAIQSIVVDLELAELMANKLVIERMH